MTSHSLTSLIALCLCATLVASAQCPDAGELNITATHYNQENGLPSNMQYGIAKDHAGFRYFLTVNGTWVRYDGISFSNKGYDRFRFDHIGLKGFAADTYTDEYIGQGHYKYGKDKGTPYRWGIVADTLLWTDAQNNSMAFPFPKELRDVITGFFPHRDFCWITAPGKAFRFDLASKKYTPAVLPDFPAVYAQPDLPFIFSRKDGTTFLLNQNMLLRQNGAASFEKFALLADHYIHTFRYELIMDTYLYASEANYIYEANLDNGAVTKINMADYTDMNVSGLTIMYLGVYNDLLLISTSNAGLFIYNRCTNSMRHFQYKGQNVDEAQINSVVWTATDDDNLVWMATDGGMVKLEINTQKIKTFMPAVATPMGICNNCNNVRAIYSRDNNNLLVGTLKGLFNFNLASGRFDPVPSPVDNTPVWNDRAISAITGDGLGNIFIADWEHDGILLLNTEKKKLINILPRESHPEFNFTYADCIYYDSHHTLWLGTREGIVRITGMDTFIANNYSGKLNVSDRLPGEPNAIAGMGACFAINEDSNGNIWFGATDGLYIYNYTTGSVTKYVHTEGNSKSISDNEVRAIHISGNDAWLATNMGGLNHFDIAAKTFTAFTTEDGLPNNSIYTILEDDKGFLWLGTNGGLCRFNKADHTVRTYAPRDGAQNFEFNTNAVATTADGKFCFGGRTGFNIFHPDSLGSGYAPPKPVITKFKIFDKEYPVSDSVIHLAHDQNSFTFDFVALNYFRIGDNQYAYMMEGADKDWTKSGNRQFTGYNNLPPGQYTFKVRAANYTGVWNEGIASITFIIDPAWYKTWWFRVGLSLVIAALIYGLYRYRLRQVMKLHAVRDRIAGDLHDEIGSTLSSISISSTIIQGKLNGSNPEVNHLLQQVSTNTDNMMEALSDIVWTINTGNDRFDNVVNRMRAFAVELLEPCNISIHFKVSDDVVDIHLNMQQRKNLYLIFKEAINNIVKYSGAKNVYITIERKGKALLMSIKDDGKGFEASPLTPLQRRGEFGGNGIPNMKKRAEEMKGEIKIHSVPEQGTTLNLSFTI